MTQLSQKYRRSVPDMLGGEPDMEDFSKHVAPKPAEENVRNALFRVEDVLRGVLKDASPLYGLDKKKETDDSISSDEDASSSLRSDFYAAKMSEDEKAAELAQRKESMSSIMPVLASAHETLRNNYVSCIRSKVAMDDNLIKRVRKVLPVVNMLKAHNEMEFDLTDKNIAYGRSELRSYIETIGEPPLKAMPDTLRIVGQK